METKQSGEWNVNAYACASKCIQAAIQTVCTEEPLDLRGMFDEAWPLTIGVLAIAATSLLVAELRALKDDTTETVVRTSTKTN